MIDRLNKLCKWRSLLAGWHLGSRPDNAPGVPAMRDLMDKWLVMRAEMNAVAELLIEKGVFTSEEFRGQLQNEAQLLDQQLERMFQGFRTTATGIEVYDSQLAKETMTTLHFPG